MKKNICCTLCTAMFLLGTQTVNADAHSTVGRLVNVKEQDQENSYLKEKQKLSISSSTKAAGKATQTEMTYETRINTQSKLLNNNKPGGKNYQELQTLTDNGIAVTSESLEDLRTSFDFSVIKVDLAEPENLRHALMNALDFTFKNNSKNNFIIGSNNILNKIRSTDSVKTAVTDLQNFLRSMNVSKIDDQAGISELLQTILNALNSSGIGIDNPFGKFVSGILEVYRTESARRAADEIMLRLGGSVEQALNTNVLTTSASLGVSGNVNGVNIGGSVGASKTGQSLFSNFYTISKNKKVEFKVGAGFSEKLINLSGSIGADMTNMAVYNSIEQLLDSSERIPTLQFKAVKEMADSRLRMQRRERKQLALFRDNVEGYYKMIRVVPISTYVEWPTITRASEAAKLKLLGVNVSGSATLADLGITVKLSRTKINAISSNGYLTLLNPDCSSAVSVRDPNYPLKFIGVDYDYSARYISVKNSIEEGYDYSYSFESGISAAVSRGRPVHEAFEVAINTILGDLRRYNDIIASIAEITDEIEELKDNSKKEKDKKNEIQAQIKKLEKELKELEDLKHEFEERWKKAKSSREGREGVLKSMIVTLSHLKELAEEKLSETESAGTARVTELFKQCYAELQRLAQLHEFSKSESKRRAAVTVVGDTKWVWADTYAISLPGGAAATFVHNHGKIPDWDMTVSLPTTIGGIIAKELILNKLNSISQELGQKPSKDVDKNMVNVIQTAGSVLSDQLSRIPSVPLPSGTTGIGHSGSTTVNIGLKELVTPPDSKAISLPNQKIVVLPGKEYSIMYTQIQTTSNFNVGLKANAGLAAINASVGQAIGKKIWLGGDLYFWSGKYNAFTTGLKDKTPATKVNTPWETLVNNQADQLKKLFISLGNNENKIMFELQSLYNGAYNSPKINAAGKNDLESAYKRFITACETFAKNPSAENYQNALDAFNKILAVNYKYPASNPGKKEPPITKKGYVRLA